MSDYIWYILVGTLATWRLTRIINEERIAQPIRRRFGEHTDIVTGHPTYPATFMGYLISCFWCLSVWVAILITLMLAIHPLLPLPLALSMLAIVLQEKVKF